jgi:hypothetical protein
LGKLFKLSQPLINHLCSDNDKHLRRDWGLNEMTRTKALSTGPATKVVTQYILTGVIIFTIHSFTHVFS